MGQKIHPTGFRLAVTKAWTSKWYANSKNFPVMLAEDIKVREYLKKKLAHASVGKVVIVVDDGGRLRAVGFSEGHPRMDRLLGVEATEQERSFTRTSNPGGMSAALRRYFAGDLGAIEGLPVHMEGTEFQRCVWRALLEIPCGETRSYGDLARALGDRNLAQAVGTANGRNPIAVVIPCHRVIGADGSLVGYAGGLDRKRFLLSLEEPSAPDAGRLF